MNFSQNLLSKAKELLVYLGTTNFLWLASLVVTIITFIVTYYKARNAGGSPLALHYNVIIGVDVLGSSRNLYIVPLAGLIIFAINFVLYRYVPKDANLVGFLTAFTTLACCLILLLSMLFLFRVN